MTSTPSGSAYLVRARVATYGPLVNGRRLAPGSVRSVPGTLVPFMRGHAKRLAGPGRSGPEWDGHPIGWAIDCRDVDDQLEATLWVPNFGDLVGWTSFSIAHSLGERDGDLVTLALLLEVALMPEGADTTTRIVGWEPTDLILDAALSDEPVHSPTDYWCAQADLKLARV